MKKDEPFSLRARLKSFAYAIAGLTRFFRAEHNSWIHLVTTLAVVILSLVTGVSGFEAVILVIVIGLVWAAELFNTAIEKMMDFISTERKEEIKEIKDLSAAAVLVFAIVAVVCGCIIFVPKLF